MACLAVSAFGRLPLASFFLASRVIMTAGTEGTHWGVSPLLTGLHCPTLLLGGVDVDPFSTWGVEVHIFGVFFVFFEEDT